ncbi:putative transcription factor C2C2-CO-like family [Helianthus annuus]|uniref:Putative CCT domain-containing protein n=1 Tax=Helianthus annuus TaxID=4232 RepID=A0A251VBQ8_HELAN|nr:zinc finger protein CONSTANS [Helianthus annuus]KAF5816035.1 putative transcription factor C2C2-CO-like family [Helianthus annuus]KAJ0594422.1 putative transcription factor C2C2-CO-like family [Helianthus annuus]KAJ0602577.1 putative transcription factor C2C2-CO-like family [Helianthus annuus]KAJ0609437.1 putative transcription factor C2C2-CO-like family [Helianthus annuus]KAJ0769498.1 putative transcription factor C2C2-CO-like family [Helianthus annuus]
MSSDLFEFEECFFTDPFSPLSDSSSIDILKAFQENNYNLNPLTHENLDPPFDEIDQIAPTNTPTTLLSSSPPSHQLENLSLNQMGNSVNSLHLCNLEVKTEERQPPFYDYYVNNNSFLPHSYGGYENAMKMMQRSFSSKSFDGRPNGFLFQPKFDSLIESSSLHDFSSSSSHMRKVCSAGDLQSLKNNHRSQTLSSSPLATEGSLMEEGNFKVGRYSPEERKERILRYKAKRTQRNFNKTIKYACRKTLADNRPRIRGRFARNDEPEETTPKALNFQRYEDEDELWMEGLQEEYYYEGIPRQHFFNTHMPTTQFHQFSYVPK